MELIGVTQRRLTRLRGRLSSRGPESHCLKALETSPFLRATCFARLSALALREKNGQPIRLHQFGTDSNGLRCYLGGATSSPSVSTTAAVLTLLLVASSPPSASASDPSRAPSPSAPPPPS